MPLAQLMWIAAVRIYCWILDIYLTNQTKILKELQFLYHALQMDVHYPLVNLDLVSKAKIKHYR